MNGNFVTATQIMAFLTYAQKQNRPASSQEIADNIHTNAVVVRRLSQRLAKAGLVETQMGVNGGARLTKPAEQITLKDILKAVETGGNDIFSVETMVARQGECSTIIESIQQTITDSLNRVKQVMNDELATLSIRDVLETSLKSAHKGC